MVTTLEPTQPEIRQREVSSDVIIRAEGIEKTYSSPLPFTRSVEVLKGVDLKICAGEIVGIVGQNGSGKSTLMKILVGMLTKDAGTITVNGTIGWCPQETLLYERLTVHETFALFGEGYGLSPEQLREAKNSLAERLGFEKFLDYRVDHLSGGNRQKVNLSIALMHDPDVLLLDEPYTGFDWNTYLAFWDLTADLVERGTGIVIISHLVEEKKRFDHISQLQDGKLHRES